MTRNKTKVLLFDIENSPNLGFSWGKYEQNIISFQQEWYMLSFSYKWLGDRSTKAYSLPDFKGYKNDKTNDKALVTKLWELLDEADVVIGHNSDRFDIRKANARFLEHGLTPPSPYKTVDTLKLARKHFMFNTNKLNDICERLGIGKKVATGGFDLWLGCMAGDKKAWKTMVKYNKMDVELLEQVYLKLRPWGAHPNINILDEALGACPTCGSTHIQKRGFSIIGRMSKVQRFQCIDCGKWSQGKAIKIGLEIR